MRLSLRCCIVTLLVARHGTAAAQASKDSSANFGWKQLGVAAAVLTTVIVVDAPIARRVHATVTPASLNTARQFDRFGDPTGMVPIVAAVALGGLITHSHRTTSTAIRTVEAIAVASAVTQAGKHLFGRIRPYGDPDLDATDFSFFSGDPAFPSGHSAAAFAMATALGDASGKLGIRIALFGLATGTGWARVAEEKHWLSDVVAGAAVGVLSARFVEGRIRLFGIKVPHVLVGPRELGVRWAF